jgi:spermidine synthase
VDNDPEAQELARRQHLAGDPRVAFHLADAAEFLETLASQEFDLVCADTWAEKFHISIKR